MFFRILCWFSKNPFTNKEVMNIQNFEYKSVVFFEEIGIYIALWKKLVMIPDQDSFAGVQLCWEVFYKKKILI